MARLTGFQRWLVAITAFLVALRLFFPVEYGRYGRTDFAATVLQVFGILILAGALLILAPSPSREKVSRTLSGVALIPAWLAYVLLLTGGGVEALRPRSTYEQLYGMHYGVLKLRDSQFIGLAVAMLPLAWLTWVWVRKHKNWPALVALGLTALVFAWATQWEYFNHGRQRVNRWTGARQTYQCRWSPAVARARAVALQPLRQFNAYWWDVPPSISDEALEEKARETLKAAKARQHPRWDVVLEKFSPIIDKVEETRGPLTCMWNPPNSWRPPPTAVRDTHG